MSVEPPVVTGLVVAPLVGVLVVPVAPSVAPPLSVVPPPSVPQARATDSRSSEHKEGRGMGVTLPPATAASSG